MLVTSVMTGSKKCVSGKEVMDKKHVTRTERDGLVDQLQRRTDFGKHGGENAADGRFDGHDDVVCDVEGTGGFDGAFDGRNDALELVRDVDGDVFAEGVDSDGGVCGAACQVRAGEVTAMAGEISRTDGAGVCDDLVEEAFDDVDHRADLYLALVLGWESPGQGWEGQEGGSEKLHFDGVLNE